MTRLRRGTIIELTARGQALYDFSVRMHTHTEHVLNYIRIESKYIKVLIGTESSYWGMDRRVFNAVVKRLLKRGLIRKVTKERLLLRELGARR